MGENSQKLVVVNGSEYVLSSDECRSCEFHPPCRLCSWVGRDVIDDVYRDVEGFMEVNRKDHIRDRKKLARARGVKEGKGRGSAGRGHKKPDPNKPDIMTI